MNLRQSRSQASASRAALHVALPLVLILGGAAAHAAKDTFDATTDVVEVQIPINVVGKDGQPIRGLTAEDFEIIDRGKPQEIVDFRVIDLETIEPGISRTEIERSVPASARRHFLLLFDLSFSQPHSILRAREAARQFVVDKLHPTDLVAVATHSIENGAQLLVTFTPDRAQLARAIDTLGAPRLLQLARQDPLRFMIDDPDFAQDSASSDLVETDAPAADLAQSVVAHLRIIAKEIAKSERSFARGRVSTWSRSMSELARSLDSVSGRKHVVYFSEGFDGRLLFGRRPSADDQSAQEDAQNLLTGNIALVDTDQMYGNTGLQSEMALMLEQFRRADCVIQAVDIGGLRADRGEERQARTVGQDALFYIADDTGGELYRNANNFGEQLGQVLSRSSVTYLATIRPKNLPMDGSYHNLKVKADVPRGGRISARKGYYAPRPYEELHPFEKSLLAADAIGSAEDADDVAIDVLAAPFRANLEAAYVPVIIEANGATLLVGHEKNDLPIELFAYVTDDDGAMKDFFSQRVNLDLSDGRRDLFEQTGLKYYGHLDLKPGSYLIRVMVRNASTGRIGVRTVPVEVPEYVEATAMLLQPFIVDESQWFLVREQSENEYSGSVIYPFTVKGEPYIPSARPAVSAESDAEMCLVAYNLEASEFDLEGTIVDEDGETIAEADFAEFERTVTGIQGVDKFVARLQTAGLAEGEYTLRVALTDGAGARHMGTVPLVVN